MLKIKFPSLSLYYKLILIFLLLLLPLYALSLKVNEMGSDVVKDEVTKSMLSRAQLYMNLLEFDFDKIAMFQQGLVNDEDLLKLSNAVEIMSDFERSKSILRLQSRLYLIKQSSKFIGNVSIHIPRLNRTVSSNSNFIEPFNKQEFDALVSLGHYGNSTFIHWENKVFSSLLYPFPSSLTPRTPIFIIAVELSVEEIKDALQQFTTEKKGGAIFFNEQADLIISNIAEPLQQQFMHNFPINGDKPNTDGNIDYVKIENESYLFVTEKSFKLDSTLLMFVPEQHILEPLQIFRVGFWLISLVSILLIILFSYQIYRLIHKPLATLVRSFRKVESGDLGLVVHYTFKDEFRYLYDQFNSMVSKLNVLIHEVYEQRYRARLSELRHLQSQINPHFLYNSFHILYRMAKLEDYNNVIRFTQYLGDYFQFITRDGSDEVTLEAEAKYAKTYTDIQNFRFTDRIVVDFGNIPNDYRNILVPRLILQPIIENAYNHGLEDKVKDGLVRIAFIATEDRLVISIEDNGETLTQHKLDELNQLLLSQDDSAEITGINNVHRRLQIKYGNKSGLRISLRPGGGLLVEIVIPLDKPNLQSENGI